MKIGFLLLREPFFKTMGYLIQAARDRGHKVDLLYDKNLPLGPKAYQQITKQKLQVFIRLGGQARPFRLDDLSTVRAKYGLDVLVTHEGYYFLHEHLRQLKAARESGLAIVSLAHFYENIRHSLDSLLHFDKTFYLSEYAVDTHFAIDASGQRRQALNCLFSMTGSPMFDQLSALDRNDARREFSIPDGKRVVVLFAPVINAELRWRHLILGEQNRLKRVLRILVEGAWSYLKDSLGTPSFWEIAKEIKDFCDRNNAFLIIKSRKKQKDDERVAQLADLYLGGDEDTYFPIFTSYKLLAAADLCITAMSMSVLESVAAGVPVWNHYIPYAEYEVPPNPLQPHDTAYFEAIMGLKGEGPFNFPPCVTNIDSAKILTWFRTKTLADAKLDPGAAREYSRRFLGVEDSPASERILNSIESLVAEHSAATAMVAQQ